MYGGKALVWHTTKIYDDLYSFDAQLWLRGEKEGRDNINLILLYNITIPHAVINRLNRAIGT